MGLKDYRKVVAAAKKHRIKIKSDQNGIESCGVSLEARTWTFAIKSDQNGIERNGSLYFKNVSLT